MQPTDAGENVEQAQDTQQAYAQQLLSQNWKSRKEVLDIIQSNPDNAELTSVFWQLVGTLMRETNIQCLSQTLTILQTLVTQIPRNMLEEVVYILVNNNLQN